MEFTGIIKDVLEPRTGTGKNGEWKVQTFVIVEDKDKYPNGMLFEVFGDKLISQFDLKKEDKVTISFDIKVTDWKGKYFNQIRAYKCEKVTNVQSNTASEKTQQSANIPSNNVEISSNEQSQDADSDKLPF